DHRRVRRRDRLGGVLEGILSGLVRPDLVALGAVGVEGEGHRRRAPAAVVAVAVAVPLADSAGDLALTRVARVAVAEDRQDDRDPGGGAPVLLQLVSEDG